MVKNTETEESIAVGIESLRGLAAIAVALFHSSFIFDKQHPIIAQGPIFVDFFFVLSGFVMAFAYQKKIMAGMRFSEFFLLRLGRLYPLHVFMLFVWLPYILLRVYVYDYMGLGSVDPGIQNNMGIFFSNLFLVNSLGLHDYLAWNYPSWSIGVEFFTYMIFFAVLATFRKSFLPLYALLIATIAYAALYMFSEGSMFRTFDLGLVRCLGGFFLGVFVYHLSSGIAIKPGKVSASVLEVAVLSLMIFAVLPSTGSKNYQLASFLVFGLVIFVFSIQAKGLVSQLLNLKPLLFLGSISYSIYTIGN
jgi:peptidoglycan/LPS O-acetylase OafA/YrhL